MAGIKPNDFQEIFGIPDNTELYSQTGNVNRKFTVATLIAKIKDIIEPDTFETTIDVTALEISTLGTSPVELLPAPGAGKFYTFEGIAEYTGNLVPFSLSNDAIAIVGETSYVGALVNGNLISTTSNRIVDFSSKAGLNPITIGGSEYNPNYARGLDERIILTTYANTDPSAGTLDIASDCGTLKIRLKYRIHTFGI